MNTKTNFLYAALLVAMGAIVGFLESLLPIPIITQVPGIKLGFANIVNVVCIALLGKKYALAVGLIRPVVVFLFSGNIFSLALSLCGAAASLAGVLTFYFLREKGFISYVGLSAVSAALHITGQLLCAGFIMKTTKLFAYAPLLIILSCVCAVVTGIVMNMVIPIVKRSLKAGA